jgi:hypothetical protein
MLIKTEMKFFFICKMKLIFLFLAILSNTLAGAYDWEWWNKKHNWDGKIPQQNYIKRVPLFMGPNAVPVPILRDSKIGHRSYFSMGSEYHFSNNEKTYNPYFHLYYTIQKNRIAFEMYTRPFEFFETDTLTRDLRFAKDEDAKGYSKGDTYFATRVRVFENFYKLPDFTIDAVLKTTTGKNLDNARHTNAPAYSFFGTLAKNIFQKNEFKIRFFFNAGTFIWQMNDAQQNDALLWGTGMVLENKNISNTLIFGGYRGYQPIGDKPFVFRYLLNYNLKNLVLSFQYQYGFKDFIKNSLQLTIAYKLNFIDRYNKW